VGVFLLLTAPAQSAMLKVMNPQRTVIHKHWIGWVIILLTGGVAATLIVYGAKALELGQAIDYWTELLFYAVAALTAFFSIVNAVTYWRSTIVFDAEGVTVTNWPGLFFSVQSRADWTDLEDVTATQAGIVAKFFDYGTVRIQTAGTRSNLEMTMLPDPQALAGFVQLHLS